jgi:hypothetical protein
MPDTCPKDTLPESPRKFVNCGGTKCRYEKGEWDVKEDWAAKTGNAGLTNKRHIPMCTQLISVLLIIQASPVRTGAMHAAPKATPSDFGLGLLIHSKNLILNYAAVLPILRLLHSNSVSSPYTCHLR